MKGVIFTELIEMMEDLMGLEFTNKVIEDARLDNEGAYTAIGTYPQQDMFKLMASLSKYAGNSQESLLQSYGEYLFYRIADTYQKELADCHDTFSFLQKLNDIVKVEVFKLEPKATMLPLSVKAADKNTLEILYSSERKLTDLLQGIIVGSVKHFQEKITVEHELLKEDGSRVRILLKKETA